MPAYALMADRRTSAISQSASTSGRTMMAKLAWQQMAAARQWLPAEGLDRSRPGIHCWAVPSQALSFAILGLHKTQKQAVRKNVDS